MGNILIRLSYMMVCGLCVVTTALVYPLWMLPQLLTFYVMRPVEYLIRGNCVKSDVILRYFMFKLPRKYNSVMKKILRRCDPDSR